MATGAGLESMLQKRIDCIDILMAHGEWHMAAYLMGYALELALKATICRTLKLVNYPGDMKHKDKQLPDFFRTHFFDRLLLLSGLSEQTFTVTADKAAFDNWSLFTAKLQGDWVAMRYFEPSNEYDEPSVKALYKYLIGDKNSIINTIRKTWN